MRRFCIASLLIAATACASSPKGKLQTVPQPGLLEGPAPRVVPPPTEEERALAARAERAASELYAAQLEVLWREWTGQAPRDGGAVPEAGWLIAPETLAAVERVAAHPQDPALARSWERLHAFLLGEALHAAVWDEDERLRRLHEEIVRPKVAPFAGIMDAEERRGLGMDLVSDAAELAAALEGRRRALLQEVARLGYGDPLQVAAILHDVQVAQAEGLARALLEGTDELWREAFGRAALLEVGLPLSDVRWVDLPRIFHGAGFDVPLRARSPRQSLDATLSGLGVDLGSVEGLVLDDVARPDKDPRPLCLSTEVGGRLSLPPDGGPSHRALFREAGCALFAAQASGPPWRLDEAAITAFASLFEAIPTDRVWLQQMASLTEAEARARDASASLRKLHLLRTQAGKLLFEVRKHREALEEEALEAAFSRTMERALLFPVEGGWVHLEQDELLASVDVLRGEALGAAVAEALGQGWWSDPGALPRLRELQAAGTLGAPALGEATGHDGGVDALVRSLQAGLDGFLPSAAAR